MQMRGKEYEFYDRATMMKKQLPNLHVSTVMMIASGLFWLAMFFCGYHAIRLSSLYMTIMKAQDVNDVCTHPFNAEEKINVDKLDSYPNGHAGPYLTRFAPGTVEEIPAADDGIPPIVTGVSSAQFYQVQGLIQHLNEEIKPEHPGLKFIIYDVGLWSSEFELLRKYCKCTVRKFQTSSFPLHVEDFSNMAWRPLLLQSLLQEFGSVIYIEPTTRFKSATSINIIMNRGPREFFAWDMPTPVEVVAYTHPAMFAYLEEEMCAFRDSGMIDTEILVLFQSIKTWRMIMKPWLKCALNKDCIAPSGARRDFCFHMRRPRTTGCHYFDQSALSVVLNRALQVTIQRDKYVPPRISYRMENEVTLFPEQPWAYIHLLIFIGILIGIYIGQMFFFVKFKTKLWRMTRQ